jgi:hypothetical protein
VLAYCDNRASAKIIKLVPGAPECALDTDNAYVVPFADPATGATMVACSRDLTPPHRGDPGQGGGLLRIGDCMDIEDDSSSLYGAYEAPCVRAVAVGHRTVKITATVERVSGCVKRDPELVPYTKAGPGVPAGRTFHLEPDRDWPAAYGPVLCLKLI